MLRVDKVNYTSRIIQTKHLFFFLGGGGDIPFMRDTLQPRRKVETDCT